MIAMLTRPDAPQADFDDEFKRQIYIRDGGICQICGADGREIAHWVHRGIGGDKRKNVQRNVLLLCNGDHARLDGRGKPRLRIEQFDPCDRKTGLSVSMQMTDGEWKEIEKSRLAFYTLAAPRGGHCGEEAHKESATQDHSQSTGVH